MDYILTYNGELYHYGVKGMKWGVRRFQNLDGSLTDAGKERYYNDAEQRELYEQSKGHVAKNVLYDRYTITNNEDIAQAGEFLRKQNEVITGTFNQLSKAYDKDIAAMKTNSKFMAEAKKRLNDELGGPDKVDDEELLDWVIDDIVYDNIHTYSSSDTKDLAKKFTQDVDQYYKNARSITDDLVGAYGDRPVASIKTNKREGRGLFSKTTVISEDVKYKDAVEMTLHEAARSSWVRYMNNHTEATWIESDSIPELAAEIKKQWGYSN